MHQRLFGMFRAAGRIPLLARRDRSFQMLDPLCGMGALGLLRMLQGHLGMFHQDIRMSRLPMLDSFLRMFNCLGRMLLVGPGHSTHGER